MLYNKHCQTLVLSWQYFLMNLLTLVHVSHRFALTTICSFQNIPFIEILILGVLWNKWRSSHDPSKQSRFGQCHKIWFLRTKISRSMCCFSNVLILPTCGKLFQLLLKSLHTLNTKRKSERNHNNLDRFYLLTVGWQVLKTVYFPNEQTLF